MLSRALSAVRRTLLRIELAAAEMDAEILQMELDYAPERLRLIQEHIQKLRSQLHPHS